MNRRHLQHRFQRGLAQKANTPPPTPTTKRADPYLIPSLDLPDPNDHHVLAAAIHSGAEVIVTYNLKDFLKDRLDKYDVQAWSPDFFYPVY